ncbi:MAG: dihydrolipoyl dehydrogenase [Planctomycetota bacterium]|nr:MAG: dihydrolipoyl dehydrogenase [Planctomycetota bacterium]
MAEIKTDVAVLGAGPAGYVCAIRLAQYGRKVVVVEQDNLGGTCLNVGCIPSKAMIVAGHFMERARTAAEMGISVGEPKLDIKKLVDWKSGVVRKLTGGVELLFKKRSIQWLKGKGTVVSPNSIDVKTADGVTRVSARDLVLASGSEPVTFPGFEFGEHVWSSTEALAPAEVPHKLLIVGGGYIGMELGMFYAHIGTKVAVVEALDAILPGTDPELSRVVARKAQKAGIEFHTGSFAREWKKKGKGVEVRVETGGKSQSLEADRILMTVGRRPVTAGIGLEAIGLKTVKAGFLEVNAQRQTKAPHVYAVGDIAGQPMLAHKGSAEGLAAAAAIAGIKGAAYDVRAVPAVIFTDPEIAYVGMTEDEARKAGHEVKTGRFSFGANGRALALRAAEGFIKVVADARDDVILGVQMVGPEVTELIAEATLAIEAGLTSEDVALTVHAHPTLPEVMMEACEDVHGLCIHAAK